MTFPPLPTPVFPSSSTRENSSGSERVESPKFSGPEWAALDESRSMKARKKNRIILIFRDVMSSSAQLKDVGGGGEVIMAGREAKNAKSGITSWEVMIVENEG